MNKIEISDIKIFMSKLLIKEDFDEFLLKEATITTYNTFSIDGRIKEAFYSSEELEAMSQKTFSQWYTIKPYCYNIIKGKKLPVSFKIVLKMNDEVTLTLLKESGAPLNIADVEGLYLTIKYENNLLDCISATSLYTFTMDKTLENHYDKSIEKFLLALS